MRNEVRDVSKEQVQEFFVRLRKIEFWSLPTEDRTRMGVDGAEWILEGAQAATTTS